MEALRDVSTTNNKVASSQEWLDSYTIMAYSKNVQVMLKNISCSTKMNIIVTLNSKLFFFFNFYVFLGGNLIMIFMLQFVKIVKLLWIINYYL